MPHINSNHYNVSRTIALIGLLIAIGLPSVSHAITPDPSAITPVTAATDAPCEQAVIALEINVSTGNTYLVTATGNVLVDNDELNVHFGSLSTVVLDLEFTAGEWEVEISPTGSSTEIYYTRGGALRYAITVDPDEYVLSFTELASSASTMMNMVPVMPVIVVKPDEDCPPA